MLFVTILAVLIALALGLVVKYALEFLQVPSYTGAPHRISWHEYGAVAVLLAVIIAPSVSAVGKHLSVDNIVTYQQFLNGVETKAVDNVTHCVAGSSGSSESSGESNCTYEYDTGETYTYYTTETETYPCTGSDGKASTCTRPVQVPHTGNIYSPYATVEHHYSIRSSFVFKENDPYQFDTVYLDKNPKPYGRRAIPQGYPRGAPADWLDARRRLDAGDPRPVTAVDSYKNYILASGDDNLNAYSTDIRRFRKAGLLPPHTAGIMSDPIHGPSKSQADKVSFVGVHVPDRQAWQRSVMRFNSALGIKLQGDAHVVLVDASRVPGSDSVPYLNALKAYWQGPQFAKRALAKNAIILVLGVGSNSSIEWAEASTGMPFGNENMDQHLKDYLPGKPLDPKAIFGEPRTVIHGDHAQVTHPAPQGVAERVIFQTTPFKRASMSCADKSCVGFENLLDTIEPTKGQKIWMIVVVALLSMMLWFAVGIGTFVDKVVSGLLGRPTDSTSQDPYNQYMTDLNRDRGYSRFE